MVKPALAGKSQACAPVELSGVVGDSAYRERSRGTWEIRRAGVLTKKAQLGIHNQLVLHGRKSEGIVVAGKRGNSRGETACVTTPLRRAAPSRSAARSARRCPSALRFPSWGGPTAPGPVRRVCQSSGSSSLACRRWAAALHGTATRWGQ